MNRGLGIFAVIAGTLLIAIAFSVPHFSDQLALKPPTSPPPKKEYVHKVVEGLSVQSGEYAGLELLRIGSCRIEKQRKGGFTFGAFNTLVIDQLEVVLPPLATLQDMEESASEVTGSDVECHALASELKSLLSQYPQFSSLCIHGLQIGRMDSSDKYRSLLQARKVTAGRSQTLILYDCGFLASDGQRIQCNEATLELKPPFHISTGKGTFSIVGIMDGLGPFLGTLAGK